MGAVQALEGLPIQTPTPLNRSNHDLTITTPQSEETKPWAQAIYSLRNLRSV
jgi:hypothetical protein